MTDAPESPSRPPTAEEAARAAEEAAALDALAEQTRAAAPKAANAMGAAAFAVVVVVLGAIGYYALDRANPGGRPYAERLDSLVRVQAERDFQATGGARGQFAPDWPLRLYHHARGDAALFAALAGLLAWLLMRRERARGTLVAAAQRRALEKELAEVRERLDALEKKS